MEQPKFEEFGELGSVKVAMKVADTFEEGEPISEILIGLLMISLFVLNKMLENTPPEIQEVFKELREQMRLHVESGCRAESNSKTKPTVH